MRINTGPDKQPEMENGKKMRLLIFLAVIQFFPPSASLRLCRRGSEAELMLRFSRWPHRSPAFGQAKAHLCRCCFHAWVSEDATNDSTKWLQR